MDNASSFGVLLIYVGEALFAFFVAAPCVLNAVSLFGVQKQFAQVMVEEGIVPEAIVKQIHPKKQLAGVIISLLVLAALVLTCAKTAPEGFICGGVAFLAGCLKYRKIIQYNSLTVKRFRNTYKDQLNSAKFNKFVDTHF